MNIFQVITGTWQKISLIQRALLVAVLMTCIIAGGFLTHWASRPDMRMLYQQLDPEEASMITEKISEKNIAYELRDGGTALYVPKQHVYQLRLDMAREGLPSGGQLGYKLFDTQGVGVSPTVQDVNLKRALEDEIAKSVQMIEGVTYARIHIVSAKQVLFTAKADKTTASVVLRLKAGYRLSPSNIAAITNLVAGAVEGLKPENITVADSKGNLLAKDSKGDTDHGAGTVQDYRERVEKNLEEKVLDMLTLVLGPGRASVKVSAVLNMESGSVVTENYDPAKKVAKKEETKSNSEKEASTFAAEGGAPVAGGEKKDEVTVTEYSVGKTIEQKINLPGKIVSLSVAAIVDLSISDANGAVAENSPKIMDVAKVEGLIANALGLNMNSASGGSRDSLSVVEARFYRPDEEEVEDKGGGLDYVAIAGQASFGIMAICALIILKLFSSPKKKYEASVPALGGAKAAKKAQLVDNEGKAGLLPAASGEEEQKTLGHEIAFALRKNPNDVKQLFSNLVGD